MVVWLLCLLRSSFTKKTKCHRRRLDVVCSWLLGENHVFKELWVLDSLIVDVDLKKVEALKLDEPDWLVTQHLRTGHAPTQVRVDNVDLGNMSWLEYEELHISVLAEREMSMRTAIHGFHLPEFILSVKNILVTAGGENNEDWAVIKCHIIESNCSSVDFSATCCYISSEPVYEKEAIPNSCYVLYDS